jgi:two-component system alkaline phosphatase synthesis response regulator PhoP
VLIVEDEGDLATLMRAILEEEGFQVRVHPTGDCFGVVRTFRPDVIVCDYMLPLYDGHAVLQRVREEAVWNVHFILISAMPQASNQWRAWGADAFLAKPFDLDDLIDSVETGASRAWQAEYQRETSLREFAL